MRLVFDISDGFVARPEGVPDRTTIRGTASGATPQLVVDIVHNRPMAGVEMWMKGVDVGGSVRSERAAGVESLCWRSGSRLNRYNRRAIVRALPTDGPRGPGHGPLLEAQGRSAEV